MSYMTASWDRLKKHKSHLIDWMRRSSDSIKIASALEDIHADNPIDAKVAYQILEELNISPSVNPKEIREAGGRGFHRAEST